MIGSVNTALFNQQVELEKDKSLLNKKKHKQKIVNNCNIVNKCKKLMHLK